MADLEWHGQPDFPTLRRAIRHRMRHHDPALRVTAENFLGDTSRIDLLAVGGAGELVSIRIGQGNDDADLLLQSLADLTWLRPRLCDFLKFAPGLGIEPSAEPRALLFSTHFGKEIQGAIENLPNRSIDLLTYHCFRQQGQLSVLIDTLPVALKDPSQGASTNSQRQQRPESVPDRHGPPLIDPPSPSSFRTGLKDTDLRRELGSEKMLG